jgi:hypothetical protein
MPKPENLIGQGFHTNPERINKKGRPKLPDLKGALAQYLADEKDGKTALDAVVMKLRQMALQGNVKAIEMLLDRAYGKATQHTDITSGGEKITPPIQWVKPDDKPE